MGAINQDTFFSQLFQTGMSDPNSKVYLPQILLSTSNPSLNPYSMNEMDLGNQNIGGINLDITLTNLVIDGIPNVSVSPQNGGSFSLTGLNASIVAQFCTVVPPPPNVGATLSFNSDFSLSFPGNQLTGSLRISINQASLTSQAIMSGDQLENIVINLNSISVAVPSTATIIPTITFDQSGGDFWSQLFEKFLLKPSTISMIVGQINDQLSAPSLMQNLSNELTTIFQTEIRKQLNS